jgi:hypothetical protein
MNVTNGSAAVAPNDSYPEREVAALKAISSSS